MPAQADNPGLQEELRRALARLISAGPESIWLPEAQVLLSLPAVRERIAENDEKPAEALRAVLGEAIGELGESQYRRVLEIVLGLAPGTAGLSAAEKRALAGRTFRGGKRPVRAGTIRQHHEPRALRELAARLATQLEPESGGTGVRARLLEWHPAIRREWAHEQLHLWRLSLLNYDRSAPVQSLEEIMRRQGVRAWALHEMTGVFDLLLEAWLPAGANRGTVEREMAAQVPGIVMYDTFAVTEVITHWAWRDPGGTEMRAPAGDVLANPPSTREMNQIRAGEEAAVEKHVEQGTLAHIAEAPGIRFMLLITSIRAYPMRVEARAVKKMILRTIGELTGGVIQEAALLEGVGFADYVLCGKARPEEFHQLRTRLVEPIEGSLWSTGLRTHIFVLFSDAPLVREAGLSGGDSQEAEPSAVELLEKGESSRVEIRATTGVDLLPGERTGAAGAGSQAAEALMRAIVGMLNTEGGTVLVGACERERAAKDPRLAGRRNVSQAPAVGNYLVVGVEEELERGADRFMRGLSQAGSKLIEPDPWAYLAARLEEVEGRQMLRVSVAAPPSSWFYLRDRSGDLKFVFRSGAATKTLVGPEQDAYKKDHSRG